MIKTCIRCGKNFDISEAELGFYEERGLAVPDMCYSCRRQERIRRNAPVVPKGAGGWRFGRRGAGFGRGMPGIFSIVLMAAVYMVARSFFPVDGVDPPGTGDHAVTQSAVRTKTYIFRSFDLLVENYQEYGRDMGYVSEEKYLEAANDVIADPEAVHRKADSGDTYQRPETGEQVILSVDGYIEKFHRVEEEEG